MDPVGARLASRLPVLLTVGLLGTLPSVGHLAVRVSVEAWGDVGCGSPYLQPSPSALPGPRCPASFPSPWWCCSVLLVVGCVGVWLVGVRGAQAPTLEPVPNRGPLEGLDGSGGASGAAGSGCPLAGTARAQAHVDTPHGCCVVVVVVLCGLLVGSWFHLPPVHLLPLPPASRGV